METAWGSFHGGGPRKDAQRTANDISCRSLPRASAAPSQSKSRADASSSPLSAVDEMAPARAGKDGVVAHQCSRARRVGVHERPASSVAVAIARRASRCRPSCLSTAPTRRWAGAYAGASATARCASRSARSKCPARAWASERLAQHTAAASCSSEARAAHRRVHEAAQMATEWPLIPTAKRSSLMAAFAWALSRARWEGHVQHVASHD